MISRRFVPVCAAALGLALALGGCSGKSAGLPYNDSHANGSIGLCNKAGKPIKQGNVADSPFVWLSVSSSPALRPFDAYGKTATLYAFVPKPGYPPEDWVGEQITASSFYTNAAHPMAVASQDDGAVLREFIRTSPPVWNGLIELRLYWTAPGETVHNMTYPATDIQVKGNRWTVVRGGDVPCDAGSASLSTPPPPQATPTGP
jgi:hypothetical protein